MGVCVCVCVCVYGFCNVWMCVCVGVMIICKLVFTVFFNCLFYVHLFLFVLSVLM